MDTLEYIDSHTGGEPTRLIVDGGPDLGTNDPAVALKLLRDEHDWIRRTAILEPRGSDVLVGAYMLPVAKEGADAAIVFFNNAGYLGMCGHGTIGVVASLAHMAFVKPGPVVIDTPPGRIHCVLHGDGSVSIRNVASFRTQKDVPVDVSGFGTITGDIAYGGNWFFLVDVSESDLVIGLSHVEELTAFTVAIRRSLAAANITGDDGAELDHIEIFGHTTTADSRNFVLCPGNAYDRSPCGTGTSAKLACLYADGKLEPGQIWRQESVIGSVFEGRVDIVDDKIIPIIKGKAHVSGRGKLLMIADDPFRYGIHTA